MKNRNLIKYISVVIGILLLFLALGCLGSNYQDTSPSELLSGSFEGKKVCLNGVIENGSISGVLLGKSENFTGDYKDWTLSKVCGTYKNGRLEAESVNSILSITMERAIYHSNETLKIRIDFNSSYDGRGLVQVSGIKNAFNRPSINETRKGIINKGNNEFDFEFTTPSCEECTAISPGMHFINATVEIGGRTFETYRKITLERANASEVQSEKVKNDTTGTNELQTSNTIFVEYFYDPACQKCAKASPVIENVISSYGNRVTFLKYNILTDEGLALGKKYQLPGVPSLVINREKLIAYEDYNGDATKLETLLRDAIDRASTSSAAPGAASGNKIVLSVPSVLLVGFLAGFNPCLLAILAFIASVTLATTGRRRNVLLIVLMFSLGIFVTYLIVGIGILRIFEQSASLQNTIRNFLVTLISILGIWHVYDAYHLRKNTESSFYTPKAFVRLTESVTKKVSLPAAFFIGALFSLIKAPCVGAVYFVILDMVRRGSGEGLLYLAAYNFGVVLPVLVLGGAIAFGLNPEKVEKFRKDKRSLLRLITGVTLLIVAVLMYAGII